MSIQILMQTLWIVLITCEGVEAVEAAGGGVVVSCSQVLRAIGVGPFAAVEQAGQRGGGGGQVGCFEHFAVGVVEVLLG